MKNIVLIVLMHTFSLLTACSKNENNSGETPAEESGAASCLLAYKENLDKLLTLDKAAEIAEKPKERAKQKYNQVMKNVSYHSIQYVWKSGRQRQMNVMGKLMTVPANDIVELHGLKEVTLDYFKKSHRAPTQQQLAASQNEIDRAIDGKSDNPELNEKLQKLDEMKVGKETQKGTAGALNAAFAEAAKSYSDVPGLGQAAAWNSFENRLYIFEGGVELTLTVDVSGDSNVNKQKAIRLGKVLLQCR